MAGLHRTPRRSGQGRQGGRPAHLADLVNSVVGNQPLNKQPLLIAEDLERELLSRGWPAGLQIGGEPVLAHRYGVGRDVFREVVRLLEARNHARMRRGPCGGLEVVQPDLEDMIGRLAGYAYVSNLDRGDILETWVLLQAAALRVIDRKPGYDWAALAATAAACGAQGAQAAGKALIDASRSRLLAILGDLVAGLLPASVAAPLPPTVGRALAGADGAGAMLAWLRASQLPLLQSRLDRCPAERRVASPATPQSECFKNQAMRLVHGLMSATPPELWTRGHLIGNEFDLADRFGVDKSVVRQAIRLMEDAETATSFPGRGRGLVTRLPSTAPISRLLCAFFVAHGVDAADGECVFAALRMECAGAAADRATSEDKATLLATMQDLEALAAPLPVSALQCFERLQQHVAHNCLLGLSIDAVKAFLTWRMASCPIASGAILARYREHTQHVARAICAGDRDAAVRAEAAKLSALSWMRAQQPDGARPRRSPANRPARAKPRALALI